MLVNGEWQTKWNPYQANDDKGKFVRQVSSFRNWVTKDGSAGKTGAEGFKAEPRRYHLYVALICPWASRTLMLRALKKLEECITVSVVEPFLTDEGWRFAKSEGGFANADQDLLNHCEYVHQLYTKSDSKVSGRATVPILWDKQQECIVSNESADIIEMLNSAFDEWADESVDLRPTSLLAEIQQVNHYLYENLNNGVYQAGFAKSQIAYEEAVDKVFQVLLYLDNLLADGRQFIHGEVLTESDVRAFVTLIRFDAAYFGLFKCNIKPISEFQYLPAYIKRVYSLEGISKTVNFDHIKSGYYSVVALNPNMIVPVGPELTYL